MPEKASRPPIPILFLANILSLDNKVNLCLRLSAKCADVITITITRTVTCYPNQKPWLNAEVRALLKAKDAVFRVDETSVLRAARKDPNAGMARAKAT